MAAAAAPAAAAPTPDPDPDPDEPVRGGKGGDPIRVYEDGTIRLSNGIFTCGSEDGAGYRTTLTWSHAPSSAAA